VQPFYTQWQGVLYVRQGFEAQVQPGIQKAVWWTKVTAAKAVRYELADRQKFSAVTQQLQALLPFTDESFEWLNLEDQTAHISHSVVLQDGHLIASLYIAPKALLPDRDWVASLFKRERLSAMHRKALTHVQHALPLGVKRLNRHRGMLELRLAGNRIHYGIDHFANSGV